MTKAINTKPRYVTPRKNLTAEMVRDLLVYEPDTGIFRWRCNRSRCRAGDVAGYVRGDGYWAIMLFGVTYKGHRLAWFYMTGEWPKETVDHKNGNPSDNRWENLREATRSQNAANSKKRKDSRQPFKGIRRHKGVVLTRGELKAGWSANIQVKSKTLYLGFFDTPEEAAVAYEKAAIKYFGKFARAS